MQRHAVLIAALLLVAVSAPALEVTERWGHRTVTYGWDPPPPSVIEGSIQGTFAGDEPMDLIGGDAHFTRIDDTTFGRLFTWNETAPVLGVFQGQQSGAVDSVWASPAPEPVLAPGSFTFPVVNLTSDPTGIWSHETGLYVWGAAAPNWDQRGDAWERPGAFTLWDAGGAPLVQRSVALRINGGWSRCLPQKGWRIYFDRDDGEPVNHDLFGDGQTASARLLLRQTVWSSYLLKDHWATSLYRDLGHLTSRWTPAVTFLNGEYWGVYALRERLDDAWATVTLGNDPDAVDVVKDGETIHGDPAAWPDFLQWIDTWPDPGAHDFYVAVGRRLHLPAYMDWLLINVVATPGENGFAHNLVLVHLPDGRWRPAMWDQDSIIFAANVDDDYFRFYAADSPQEYAQYLPSYSLFPPYEEARPYCRIFRQLLSNAEFRTAFRQRADELLNGQLAVAAMQARMDSVLALFAPEIPPHAERFMPYSDLADVVDDAAAYNDILAQRHPVVLAQLADFMDELMDPVELSAFTGAAGSGGAALQWRTERERDNVGFAVWRALGDPADLVLVADHTTDPALAGAAFSDTVRAYRFTDTTAPADETAWYQLRHLTAGGQTVIHHWVVEVGPATVPDLVVNEFLADNETVNTDEAGEYDDWLELYNAGAAPVDLTGLYLTDDLADPLQWPLPSLTLQPGAFLLVWCDDDPEQGALHATFKLSADGEEIGLFAEADGEPVPVDTVSFGPQVADVSLGRAPDGALNWQPFADPTPGASNAATAVPDGAPAGFVLHGVTPNPGDAPLTVHLALPRAVPLVAEVYDLRGRLVRRLHGGTAAAGEHALVWDRRDAGGRPAPAGVYLIRLAAAGTVAVAKVAVVR